MLDAGAHGVIVPLVNTAEEAERAVKAAKYPPEGVRGFCFSRMNEWGVEFDSYSARANDEVTVVVMIESIEAADNIDAILAVDGLDGVLIGPYDMSGSCGVPGETGSEKVQAACRKVLEACERAGKTAGMHVVIPTEESVAKAVSDGFTFLPLGVDTVFLNEAARGSLEMARRG